MAKKTRELLFIKNTGALVGEITDDMDRSTLKLDKFLVKIIEIDDDLGEYWYGDYDTGEIRARADKPVITESFLKYNTNVEILTNYPIHKQLNILIDMLAQSDLTKTPEFEELKSYLDAARQNHRDQIDAYSGNIEAYTFISEEEELQMIEKKKNFE